MRVSTSAFITSLVASQAAATSWNAQSAFSCPSTADNQCNTQQKSGFDWQSLQVGNFGSYSDFSFSGFACANKFGKRDALTKRTFQSKCITGTLAPGGAKGPSFGCGADKKSGFSVDQYQVSVSKDTDVEFHYQMEDGSTCKHVSSCKAGGSIVQNTQCGGAKSVTCQLPKEAKQGCDIAIHSVGFKCNSVSSSAPPATKSTSVPVVIKSSTPVTTSTKPTTSSVYTSTTVSTSVKVPTLTPSIPSSSVAATSSTSTSTYVMPSSSVKPVVSSPSSAYVYPSIKPVYMNSTSTPSFTLIVSTTPSSSIDAVSSTSSSTYSMPDTTIAVVSTSSSTSTSTYVYTTPTTSIAAVSTTSSTSSIVADTTSSTSTYSSVSSVVKASSAAPSPSAGCPDVLPRCLNTWMHSCGCKDNTDYGCYCQKPDFTKNVMDCVSSWAMDDGEVQKALSYLAGICAPYVPKNPGLITNCPKSITIGVTPSVPVVSSSVAAVSSSIAVVVTSAAPVSNYTAPLVDYTTVIATSIVTTCPANTPITHANGEVTTYSTPVTSTIYSTTTSTVCTKCTRYPAVETSIAAVVTTAPLVDYTTVIATAYTTTCPAGKPITHDNGQVTSYSTPVVSTIYQTTTSTICTKCTRIPETSIAAVETTAPLVDMTTVQVTAYVTTCPAGKPITHANGEVTSYSTPVTSTITQTITSTICTKCTRVPAIATSVAMVSNTDAVTSAVAPTTAFAIPVTTITIASTYTVQCTYSTGESAGLPIPGSSTATYLQTQVTVPQVAFTTAAPVQGNVNAGQDTETPSVGLVAAATPAPVPADATAAASTTDAGYAGMTTVASSSVAAATATAPSQFMGAASANKAVGGVAALVAGLAALLM